MRSRTIKLFSIVQKKIEKTKKWEKNNELNLELLWVIELFLLLFFFRFGRKNG